MTNTPTATTTTITERDFPADLAVLKVIRAFIGGLADGLATADDAVLAGSELAANAIEHATPDGGSITVTVTVTDDMIRVDVTDADPDSMPCVADADADAEEGRGLLLVGALASRWGCDFAPESKTTWCEFATQSG